MKIFRKIDQAVLESDPRVVLAFQHPLPGLNEERIGCKCILSDGSHLIWATRSMMPPVDDFPAEWVGGSLMEFPKAGLPWFIDSLENQFFKTAKDGGLPRGQFTYENEIEGETLVIARMMGHSGYSLRNYSRKGHTLASEDGPQSMDLSDDMLFRQGLYEQLKELTEKVRQGIV